MGRAARRQQERAERVGQRRASQRPSAPSLSGPSRPSGPLPPRRRILGFLPLPRWADDIISELRKVTWPTLGETANLTVVVLVVSLIAGVILGAADVGFSWLVENTILR